MSADRALDHGRGQAQGLDPDRRQGRALARHTAAGRDRGDITDREALCCALIRPEASSYLAAVVKRKRIPPFWLD